jgi:hypothetical protein
MSRNRHSAEAFREVPMQAQRSLAKTVLGVLTACLIGSFGFGSAPASAAMVRAGVLDCTVEGGIGFIIGSSKRLTCTYRPEHGRPQLYAGRISKFGLDVGFTGRTVIVWAVLTSQVGFPFGALAGHYGGVSAEASIGLGVGANALIGGTGRAFVLQPFSVQAQTGINVAAGITGLSLFVP